MSGIFSLFLEADGTRSTQDARRPWTKRGGGSQNRLTMQCAQWNASRAAAWRHRRVAVARPMRIALCTNIRFHLTFRKRSEIVQVPESRPARRVCMAPRFHAISGQLILLTRRSWFKMAVKRQGDSGGRPPKRGHCQILASLATRRVVRRRPRRRLARDRGRPSTKYRTYQKFRTANQQI